ncbi:MAG: trehalose-phosphatase [Burkholderiaceae bacterium]
MKHLLSPEGRAALQSLAEAKALLAFDFDGTLAPIVNQPDRARAAIGVDRRIVQLTRLARVAVISGRSLADLLARIPTEIPLCIGNHGAEGLADDVDTRKMHQVSRQWLEQLRPTLANAQDVEGVVIEDKGPTLSLHFRLARDRAGMADRLSAIARQLEPAPRVIGGKFVLNLLPPEAPTKFEALTRLVRIEQADRVLFVGDDQTDELVFAQAPDQWITVRVDYDRSSQARFFVHQQSEIAILLDCLLSVFELPGSARIAAQRH